MTTDRDDPLLTPQEVARLQEISRLGLAELTQDDALQAIVQDATRELGLPIGLVSIVLDESQHFIARTGLDGWLASANGTPVEWAFCVNAVRTKRPFVVEDATRDAAVSDNPLVEHDGVRCYAGAPLLTSAGHALGTMCVIGSEPRAFSDQDIERLQVFAARVVDHLEARRTPSAP